MTADTVPEALLLVAELGVALGVKSINTLPGCWEHQVDAQWWIAMNGHTETRLTSNGQEVPPYSIYVEFNGWPAGFISVTGGILAAGEVANEDTFIAAVKAATQSAFLGRPG